MAPKNIKVTLDRVPQIAAGLRKLATTRVMAGVPADRAGRNESGDDINNAGLMKIHEDGAPEVGIPARPVVHPAIKEVQGQLTASLKKAGDFGLDGQVDKMTKQFYATGFIAQNAMRKKITTGPFVPLAPSTLAKRKAKGHKSEKPLIETGQLRRALTFVVRKIPWINKFLGGK